MALNKAHEKRRAYEQYMQKIIIIAFVACASIVFVGWHISTQKSAIANMMCIRCIVFIWTQFFFFLLFVAKRLYEPKTSNQATEYNFVCECIMYVLWLNKKKRKRIITKLDLPHDINNKQHILPLANDEFFLCTLFWLLSGCVSVFVNLQFSVMLAN